MKILAFNGSPRMKRGNTELILSPFLEGAKEEGAEIDLVYLRTKNIRPCVGCFSCWFKTPGVCSLNDDIHELREKLLAADVVIFATPVYMFSSSGYLKILMERLLFPCSMPEFFKDADDCFYHPSRYPGRKWKSLLISNGAFDGEHAFKSLIDMYERAVYNLVDEKRESTNTSIGHICIGFSSLFADEQILNRCDTFFKGMKNAGKEMVRTGNITVDTLIKVNKPLYQYLGMTEQETIERCNSIISQLIPATNV